VVAVAAASSPQRVCVCVRVCFFMRVRICGYKASKDMLQCAYRDAYSDVREYIQSLRVIIIMIIMITISTRDEGEFLRQSLSLFILSVTLGYDNIESNALSQEESATTLSYIRLRLNFFIISFSLSLSIAACPCNTPQSRITTPTPATPSLTPRFLRSKRRLSLRSFSSAPLLQTLPRTRQL